jgi:septal ring factor EnvC (AmiA/AmiB activator)
VQADRFQAELDSLRNVVTRTSNEQRRQVRDHDKLVIDSGTKTKQLDTALAEIEKLEISLEQGSKSALSAEEQAEALERQLTEEEAYTREVERQLTAVSQRLALVSQKNHEVRSVKSSIESETNGCAQADKNLSSKLLSVERQSVNQGQLLCVHPKHPRGGGGTGVPWR